MGNQQMVSAHEVKSWSRHDANTRGFGRASNSEVEHEAQDAWRQAELRVKWVAGGMAWEESAGDIYEIDSERDRGGF